ncbi:MAG: ABC transporter permease [Spirochaetaceae bacterium]|jgi:ribose transport system permease protein|nr:ABC transporter permease [Spirochaetaceae bacterium]GMO16977.1 MAG: ABC transporter permease [Termitinemataceae bacterium]
MALEKKGFNIKEHIYSFGVVFVLILLCIIMTIATPRFLTADNLRNVGAQAVVNSIVSIGMFLAILTAGIDLSVGSVLALSTMIMGLFVRNFNLNPILAMILCLGTGGLLGLCNGLMLTKLRLPHPFISTLGMKQMARGLALVVTASQPISGFAMKHKIWAGYTNNITEISIGLVIVLYVFMYIFLTRTATGRYIYAVGGNKEASRLSGINVDGILNLVYVISGGMAALAGLVLVGRTDSAYPLAGTDYETDAIAAVIIGGASFFGGIGRIGNTIVGVLLIAVLRNGLNLLRVDANLQTFAIGAVIVLAVWVDVIRQRTMKKA